MVDPGAPAAHVVVPDLEALTLAPDDARHLSSVLRLRPGERVGATDGRGRYRPCVYSGAAGLSPEGPVVATAPHRPLLTVGFVPVKGDRPEWAVQKLTEVGVDRIVLLSSERSVVRWDRSRESSHLSRLERVARAAVMQSRQVWLPEIAGVVGLEVFLAGAAGGAAGSGVAVADIGGGPLGSGVHTVLIGPEGGWSDAERSSFTSRGVATAGLGDTVLRAETAAVAAGVLMAALRSGAVAPASRAPAGPGAG